MQQGTTTSQQSVNAAAANAAHSVAALHFSAEDGGPSLAEMAQRDLDAALQLLADRAVYITGSTGAAIALRRSGKNDMLCRASTGTSAPELGALLSTEIGLSGESVRTRRTLRCDNAEQDARVNRDVCREMGISSVVVMPVVNDDQVLGVFELFSGKVNAFGERDVSALQRLSEMVETAVKLALAAESVPAALATVEAASASSTLPTPAPRPSEMPKEAGAQLETETKIEVASVAVPAKVWPTVKPVTGFSSAGPSGAQVARTSASVVSPAPGAPKKPLFWSVATNPVIPTKPPDGVQSTDQSHVPPVLRNLQKCEACGFPVSAGRALCVECEEKKWRGQLRRNSPLPIPPNPAAPQTASAKGESACESSVPVARLQAAAKSIASSAAAPAPARTSQSEQGTFVADYPISPVKPAPAAAPVEAKTPPAAQAPAAAPAAISKSAAISSSPSRTSAPELILSAASAPAQSWLSANKYILGALVLVAVTVAAILLMR